jgi:isopenicillin-N N-acyltransferase like protein
VNQHTPTDLQEIRISGEPYERGVQYGRAVGQAVRGFLADHVARINLIRHIPLSAAEISRHVSAHAAVIEREVPHLAIELRGLAAGAEISYEQALILQFRRELIGAPAGDAGGDCSTIVERRGEAVLIGQTVDQDGLISDLGLVLRIDPAEPAPSMLMFTFAGLLGYAGINSAGVAVAINLVTSETVSPGLSPYLLVREALACTSASAAVARVQRLTRASARALTIADRVQVVCCEFTPESFRSWPTSGFIRTNHFLHPEFGADERLNIFSLNGSRRRLAILEAGKASIGMDVERAFALFADHSLYPTGLCAHAEGDMRRPDTVAALVMKPNEGVLWACRGNPCSSIPRAFSLERTQRQVNEE